MINGKCKMRNRYLFSILAVALTFFILSSCKKKEEEKDYMMGSVTFEFPEYCLVGAKIDAYCTGITEPADVEYFWISSSLLGQDTVFSQQITFEIPDSAASYIVTAYARKDGYYSSTRSATITAIDPDVNSGSVSGLKPSELTFTDERDGTVYQYVKIGKLDWMSENLEYAGTADSKVGTAYFGEEVLRQVFGSLYSWNDATGGVAGSGLGGGPQGVCPPGWSVPTAEDWEDLALTASGEALSFNSTWEGMAAHLAVDAYFNEARMWSYAPKFPKSNTLGWNAIPCGHSTDKYTRFRHLMQYGMWWSSAEIDGLGAYRYIYYNASTVPAHAIDKDDFGASVRCVRLSE